MVETYGQEVGSGPEYRRELSTSDHKILRELYADISEIIEYRNDLSHGKWFVGWGNEQTTDWSQAHLNRQKNATTGINFLAGRLAPALRVGQLPSSWTLLPDVVTF